MPPFISEWRFFRRIGRAQALAGVDDRISQMTGVLLLAVGYVLVPVEIVYAQRHLNRLWEQEALGPPIANPLDKAQALFEAGHINDAAKVLSRERAKASAKGQDDRITEIDLMVGQMRAYLTGGERQTFDRLLEPPPPVR